MAVESEPPAWPPAVASKSVTRQDGSSFSVPTGGYFAADGAWRPRHIGILKSFNHRNGFGFIQCKETFDLYKQDIFLHKNNVPPNIEIGQWVEFVAIVSVKGQPQASNVTWLERKSELSGSHELRESQLRREMISNKVYTGTLKSFNTRSGYGFAACPELFEITQRDVYIHKVELPTDGVWRVGQELEFEVTQNLNGQPQAKNVVWKASAT